MMTSTAKLFVTAAIVTAFSLTVSAHAALVASWDAEAEPLGTGYGSDAGLTGTAGTYAPHDASLAPYNPAPAVVAITATGTKPAGYTRAVDNPGGAVGFAFDTFNGQYGSLDTKDATLDFYISPDSLATNNQVIWDTGGNGVGSALGLLNNQLVFAATSTTVSVDLSTVYAAVSPDFDDYLHVRAAFDLTNDELRLSVLNLGTGLLVSAVNTSYTGGDWAGTEGGGLLARGGSVASGLQAMLPGNNSNNSVAFDGQFVSVQLYDEALPSLLIPEPASIALLAVAGLLVAPQRRRR